MSARRVLPPRIELLVADVDGTLVTDDKRLTQTRGVTADGMPFAGYEMHMGATAGPDRARPFARRHGRG